MAVAVTGSPGKTEVGFTEQLIVGGGGGAMVPAWKTRPALRRAASMLARPPYDAGAKVCVHVLVVSLEDANREVVVEERRVVIHAAAAGQYRSPCIGIVVGTTDTRATCKSMNERGDVL